MKDTRQYQIIDSHTQKVVTTVKGLTAAMNAVDRRDNAYGAYRYTHRRIW